MLAEFQIIVVRGNKELVSVSLIHIMPTTIAGLVRAVPPDNIIKPRATLLIGAVNKYTAPFTIPSLGPIGIIINNCIVDQNRITKNFVSIVIPLILNVNGQATTLSVPIACIIFCPIAINETINHCKRRACINGTPMYICVSRFFANFILGEAGIINFHHWIYIPIPHTVN